MKFIYSLQSEWLKTKRSASWWLCLIGGFFLPLMFLIGFLKDHDSINSYGGGTNVWIKYFFQIWKFMAIALLPMGVILASSLITQLEYKNNTWKQLHTTPQNLGTIFLAKFSAIILMTIKFFIYFNIGLFLSAVIPCLLFEHHLPAQPFPILFFLKANAGIFIACLPIIAFQYLLSLKFGNFLIPVGVGILALVGSFILLKTWKYAYISPYSYSPLLMIGDRDLLGKVNINILSSCYFVFLMLICYYIYITKKEKG